MEVVINFDRLSHKYILMGEVAPEQSDVFMKSTNVLEKVQECEKIRTTQIYGKILKKNVARFGKQANTEIKQTSPPHSIYTII